MRIALFHNAPSGGAKRAIFEWTRRLVRDHTIDVYTLSSAAHDFCDIRPFVNNHFIFNFKVRELFNRPIGRLNQLQRWRDLGELQAVERQIANEINAGHYDLLFAHTCQFSVIPALIRHVKAPSVYFMHEPFGQAFSSQISRPYHRNNQWRNFLDRIDPLNYSYRSRLESIQQASVKKTRLLLANSLFTQMLMKNNFGVESSVCHYGVDHETFCPNPAVQKDFFLFSVGELSPRKGFDFLIESIEKIPVKERPKLKLACNTIQDAEKVYLEDLAQRHEVELELLYNQDSNQLSLEYNRALLCVYAPVQEPFGLVPLESMACGTAVVGVNEGGVVESIASEHTGLLVDRDPEQFALAIELLLSDRSLADQYGRNGRDHILKNWTWKKSTNTLKEFLAASANNA